jgi:hypothetical protein
MIDKCDSCNTDIIINCQKCGAPNCCPKCCAETPWPKHYSFTFHNGYYTLDGTKIQVMKVRDHDWWVVVDAAYNDSIQQSECLPLEDAKKAAIKMFERQQELKCQSTK